MATTIRHTHSLGPLASILILLTFRPIRWMVYAAMVAGGVAWLWDGATEVDLKPSQYEFEMADDTSIAPSDSMVFQDIHFANRSPYTVQSIKVSFRIYDCPDDAVPVSECSKLRVDDQTFMKDIAAGEGADFEFNTAVAPSASSRLRVVPIVRKVVADKDARDDSFVG